MRGHVTCVEILLETTPLLPTTVSSSPNKPDGVDSGNDDDGDASMDEDNPGSDAATAAAVGELINGVKDARGRSATHVAAFYNHVPVLQFLIGHGADVNGKDKQELTPVMLAAANGQVRYIDLL